MTNKTMLNNAGLTSKYFPIESYTDALLQTAMPYVILCPSSLSVFLGSSSKQPGMWSVCWADGAVSKAAWETQSFLVNFVSHWPLQCLDQVTSS